LKQEKKERKRSVCTIRDKEEEDKESDRNPLERATQDFNGIS
jgi:hypothetical protein